MIILLIRTPDYPLSELKKVWEFLVIQSGPLAFQFHEEELKFEKDYYDWDSLFHSMNNYRKQYAIEPNVMLIVLTRLQNDSNWFSSPDPIGTNNIFIHSSGWENFVYCDPVYPLAYEVVANVMDRILFRSNKDQLRAHDPAIGCMNDMCSWKPDIHFKLRTADICEDCIQWMKEKDISDQTIQQTLNIFNLVRQHTLFSASLQPQNEFDRHLPFNVAITKRKISSTGEPLRKFLFLIDHFDSLIRTAVIFWSAINFEPGDLRNFIVNNNLHDKPGLGRWLGSLKYLSRKFEFALDLDGAINRRIQNLVGIAEKGNIVTVRNERRGHGYIGCHDDNYREIFMEQVQVVNEIENLLNPLFNTNRMYYLNRSSIRGSNQVEIATLELSGSYAVHEEKSQTIFTNSLAGLPVEKKVFIYNLQFDQWVNLHPYFVYDVCPVCRHRHLLVYDGDNCYLDPLEGHRGNLNF